MKKYNIIFTAVLAVLFIAFAGCESTDLTETLDGDVEIIDGDGLVTDGDTVTEEDADVIADGDKDIIPEEEVIADGDEDQVVVDYPLVDSGQVTCYNTDSSVVCPAQDLAFAGQDAQYIGRQPSYLDNGDGTISDLVTGLMWEKTPSSSGFTWQEAADYCNNLEVGGHSDWRMPTLKELFSISDFSTGWPYLDSNTFDIAGATVSKDEQYWTTNKYVGSTVEGGTNAAFGVNHGTGHIKAYPALGGGPMGGKRIRAVRGATTYGINSFVDNSDGTISDEATGLMWQQAGNGSGIDWEHALSYCEDLSLAGKDDWRLPDVKELQSIVDYSRSPGASDASNVGPAIDPMFSCTPITNEAGDADYPYYWTSTSARFQAGGAYYYAWYVAFGYAVDGSGKDSHGAGAVRFDTKIEGGPAGEGGERYYNYVRCVRGGDVTIDYGFEAPVDGDVDEDVPPVDGDVNEEMPGEMPGNEPIDCADAQPGMPCCGDAICDGPETAENCAVDCAAADGDAPSEEEVPTEPFACTVDDDCLADGACPAEATMGCRCRTMPDGGSFCVPACNTDADCPSDPNMQLTCGPGGICMPQGGPQG